MATSISLIIVLGLLADVAFRKFKLPGLIGMLLVGVVFGPYVLDLIAPEMMAVSADFRKIALIVILLRAGFELRKDTLYKVGRPALIMSALPAVFEIVGVVLVAPRLLDISVLDAAVLGAILGAVSPAVVVPLMIRFMDEGRGAKKGIPTMILAASSLDDVFVIVLFAIFMRMHGGDVNPWLKLAEIPLSVFLGILSGVIPGYFLWRLFTKYDWRPPKRTIVVLGVAIVLTWIESAMEHLVPVASLLGVMAIGFIILEKSEPIAHMISRKLKGIWVFAELLLFVLVGAQVNISVAWEAGLAGAGVIGTGLIFRSAGTWLSLAKTGFSPQEKLFCTIAYIPKATVQAAIGAAPLAAGMASGDVILAVAVLSIILTAPLGALGIRFLGEKILDCGDQSPYRFKDLRVSGNLPRVGEYVRDKKQGAVWKVIEEKEEWIEPKETGLPPGESFPDWIPAITIRFWEKPANGENGRGKTESIRFSRLDAPFSDRWEILYDW